MTPITEIICDCTPETLLAATMEAPCWARFLKTDLLDAGVPHLMRIKPEFWPLVDGQAFFGAADAGGNA
jgi:hypothetical protein